MAKSKSDGVLSEVSGASVGITAYGYQWSYWGSSRLMLTGTRVVERTKFFISERYNTIPLREVTGVALVTTPNPVLIILGLLTLVFLVGIVFLILALFQRHTYLVITSGNNVLVLGCKGDPNLYEDFKLDVLDEIDRLQRTPAGVDPPAAAAAPPSKPAPLVPDLVQGRAAPAAKGAHPLVSCDECGSEYRIPAGSAGKRFKCQKCQAIISVPEEI